MMANPHHPGLQQHPGMYHGQLMGPGQPQNPGQSLIPGGMHPGIHPGMSNSNTQHMMQGNPLMTGMHPGVATGGPNAHALAHLPPQAQAQAQMFQNPQMAQGFPPDQLHQQQLLRQRQQMLAVQQGQMGLNMQHGLPAQLTAQQMAQYQAMQQQSQLRQVNLPANMASLQAQEIARRQHMIQQMAMQNPQASHQGQGGMPGQAPQMRQQQSMQGSHEQNNQPGHHQATPQMAAQGLADQHAQTQRVSQQGSQPPQSQNTQQSQSGQTPHSQTRPPPQNHQQQLQQQQAQAHAQAQQQHPQAQLQAQQAQQAQHAQQAHQAQQQAQQHAQLAQQAQQAQQQAHHQAQQTQSHNQQQGGPPGLQQPGQAHMSAQHNAQQLQMNQLEQQKMQMRQQLVGQQLSQGMGAAQFRQQQQLTVNNSAMARVMQFTDTLYSICISESSLMTVLQRFVGEYFADEGVFRQQLWEPDDRTKTYEICKSALPRYFWTWFNSGVERIQPFISALSQKDLPNNGHLVEGTRATFVYWFSNGVQLVCTGTLKALLDRDNKLELLEFFTTKHEEYLPRTTLTKLFSSDAPKQKQSPETTKSSAKQKLQRQQQGPTISLNDLPANPVRVDGINEPVARFLELVEVMSQMRDLFEFSYTNDKLRPEAALDQLVSSYSTQQLQTFALPSTYPPNMNLAMAPQGAGLRTPGIPLSQMNQFATPANTHMGMPGGLPNSPHVRGNAHTPSPGHPTSNMHAPAPPMAAQQSQQGSSSANASSNASPNVTNKRRRASAVKAEGVGGDDDTVGAVAPPKVKASPRVGGKRQKGNVAT